jgi:hypothetical protein
MSNPPAASPTAPSGGGNTGHKWTPWQIIIMFALVVLAAAVIVALIANAGDSSNGTSSNAGSSSTPGSSAPGSSPPVTTQPTTSAPTSTSAPTPVKPLKKGEVRVVHCTTSPAPRPGGTVTIIATIEADKAGTIGISAGTYLRGGDDTDYGANDDSADDPNHRLNPGAQDVRLTYNVPGGLKAGTYEISGQLWPTDDIGGDNDLTARTCATMPVR